MLRRSVTVAMLLTVAACAQNGVAPSPAPAPVPAAATTPAPQGNSRVVTAANGTRGELVGSPARGSKFSRVEIGMTQKEVDALIGPPSDTDSHITGKSFIPFYFGGDTYRLEAFYKGEGILTFAPSHFAGQANTLIRIIADPSERGFAH